MYHKMHEFSGRGNFIGSAALRQSIHYRYPGHARPIGLWGYIEMMAYWR